MNMQDKTAERSEPLYLRIKAKVKLLIAQGEWRPGHPLPSEFALADRFGVSQGTLRKALDLLTAEHVLERQQGRGTFVAEQTQDRALFQFFHMTDASGAPIVPDPISEEIISLRAPARIARELSVDTGSKLVRIRRIRALAERIATLEDSYLPDTLLPLRQDDSPLPNALYLHYERRYGISVIRATDDLSAVGATADCAAAFGVEIGTPVLLAQRTAFDLSDRAVERRESWFLTIGTGYRVHLGSSNPR